MSTPPRKGRRTQDGGSAAAAIAAPTNDPSAPSPPSAAADTNEAIAAVIAAASSLVGPLADPRELFLEARSAMFAADYEASGGRLASIVPSPQRQSAVAPADTNKRPSTSHASMAAPSPARKRVNATASPRRRLAAVASTAVGIVNAVSGEVDGPPAINRRNSLASPALADLFETPDAAPKKKKYSGGSAMVGLVPKSGLLLWMRESFVGSGAVSATKRKSDLKARRDAVFWHFT